MSDETEFDAIERRAAEYYRETLRQHSATPRGVDWNSAESQDLRFEQLLRLLDDGEDSFSILDYGCGYGALADFVGRSSRRPKYFGFDLAGEMISAARALHGDRADHVFLDDPDALKPADYVVASGVFNVRLDTPDQLWVDYMLRTIGRFARLSRRGFAFNVLTKYSDPDRRRPDLFYADPLFFFDYCKTHLSRFVTLLHDYPLYEFTLLVRQEDDRR